LNKHNGGDSPQSFATSSATAPHYVTGAQHEMWKYRQQSAILTELALHAQVRLFTGSNLPRRKTTAIKRKLVYQNKEPLGLVQFFPQITSNTTNLTQ